MSTKCSDCKVLLRRYKVPLSCFECLDDKRKPDDGPFEEFRNNHILDVFGVHDQAKRLLLVAVMEVIRQDGWEKNEYDDIHDSMVAIVHKLLPFMDLFGIETLNKEAILLKCQELRNGVTESEDEEGTEDEESEESDEPEDPEETEDEDRHHKRKAPAPPSSSKKQKP